MDGIYITYVWYIHNIYMVYQNILVSISKYFISYIKIFRQYIHGIYTTYVRYIYMMYMYMHVISMIYTDDWWKHMVAWLYFWYMPIYISNTCISMVYTWYINGIYHPYCLLIHMAGIYHVKHLWIWSVPFFIMMYLWYTMHI